MKADAETRFREAQQRHAAGDIVAGERMARETLDLDPSHVGAIEHLANILITRHLKYGEGLAFIDRAVGIAPDDAGLWYARGWCYEFAAHEIARRRPDTPLEPRSLLETAAASFRRCLALQPDGKLLDDARDLLDHVENKLE